VGRNKRRSYPKLYGFFNSDHFKNIQPVSGSQEAINEIAKDHDLVIITSRQHDIKNHTIDWIQQHFPETFFGIHFGNHYGLSGQKKSKLEMCDMLNIDMLIEDSADYANECANSNRKVLLFDTPWNRNIKLNSGNIYRINSWYEVLDHI